MNITEFESIKKFSEGSGIIPVVDSNFSMKLNAYGIYEEVPREGAEEVSELALAVSPNYTKDNELDTAANLYQNIEGIHYDQVLGYYLTNYVGYVTEGDYRMKGSSGGIGTWILVELMQNNLIDGVIHVKKNQENSSNLLFKYDISYSKEEILEGAKTKYYPVELSEVIKLIKSKSGKYAVIGIPSYIYAIRLLAKHDSIIRESIQYTIGLVCGHQKSSRFADYMGWQVGIKPGDLLDIDFRYKLQDKPANNYGIKMTGLINGKVESIIKENRDLLGQDWGQGYFKVAASDFTDDVMNETADLTIGDAWLPELQADYRGNNILIVRNPIIFELIQRAISEGRLHLDEVDAETIKRSQRSHIRHTQEELPYRLLKETNKGGYTPTKRVTPHRNFSQVRMEIQDMRETISAMSHLKFKEAVEMNDIGVFDSYLKTLTADYTKLYKKLARERYKDLSLSEIIGIIQRKIFRG